MKKLLILVGKMKAKKELFARLISERMGKDVKVVLATFSDLYIEIGKDETKVLIGGVDIGEFDLVYFRRINHSLFPLSGTLALCLDELGIKYFDTKFKEIGAGGDKFTAAVKLAFAGVPISKTIFCPKEKILSEKDRIASSLGFPIVAKNTTAQGNSGIFLLKKKEDFENLLNLMEEKLGGESSQFLFQQYIDIDKEFRLLVLGDRVAVAHKKDKRNYGNLVVSYDVPNLETVFVDVNEIPDYLKAIAIQAAEAVNIEIAGVDVCIEKETGRGIVIEVNRGPGFEYDKSKSSEISEVADFLTKNLGK
jgi:glutathione synthase/RimK-type ligase-like ATP-grasp enzyme